MDEWGLFNAALARRKSAFDSSSDSSIGIELGLSVVGVVELVVGID